MSSRTYEVEGIISERVQGGRVEYRVRWKGYSPSEDTWEERSTLNHLDLFKAYLKVHPQQKAAEKKPGSPGRGGPRVTSPARGPATGRKLRTSKSPTRRPTTAASASFGKPASEQKKNESGAGKPVERVSVKMSTAAALKPSTTVAVVPVVPSASALAAATRFIDKQEQPSPRKMLPQMYDRALSSAATELIKSGSHTRTTKETSYAYDTDSDGEWGRSRPRYRLTEKRNQSPSPPPRSVTKRNLFNIRPADNGASWLSHRPEPVKKGVRLLSKLNWDFAGWLSRINTRAFLIWLVALLLLFGVVAAAWVYYDPSLYESLPTKAVQNGITSVRNWGQNVVDAVQGWANEAWRSVAVSEETLAPLPPVVTPFSEPDTPNPDPLPVAA